LRILLTFTGFHDPYSKGLVGEDEQPGPVVSLLQVRSFDLVYLLSTPNTERNTTATALKERVDLKVVALPIQDPTEYAAILKHLRSITGTVVEEFPGAEYFISVASGTPQMHACWVLLTTSGEFPARILHSRPPRFVTADRDLVTEIDLTRAEFPIVRVRDAPVEVPDTPAPDIRTALAELGLVADHPKMVAALQQAAALADSNVPILILGATGTGKELLAKFVHRLSGRPDDNFVALDCASIPPAARHNFAHVRRASCGAIPGTPAASAYRRRNCQTTFSLRRSP
jgi:sigma54-dependent transcription regulator